MAKHPSRLLDKTRELLVNRPRTLTLLDIETKTKLPYAWLVSLVNERSSDPRVTRVETLYKFLSGRDLEV